MTPPHLPQVPAWPPRSTPRLFVDQPLAVGAEVPLDAASLPDPLPLAWRLALREVLGSYLASGYAVTDLLRRGEQAFYLLER